jgi:hypothetical protein
VKIWIEPVRNRGLPATTPLAWQRRGPSSRHESLRNSAIRRALTLSGIAQDSSSQPIRGFGETLKEALALSNRNVFNMVDILHQLPDGSFVEHCYCVINRPVSAALKCLQVRLRALISFRSHARVYLQFYLSGLSAECLNGRCKMIQPFGHYFYPIRHQ